MMNTIVERVTNSLVKEMIMQTDQEGIMIMKGSFISICISVLKASHSFRYYFAVLSVLGQVFSSGWKLLHFKACEREHVIFIA